MTTIDEAFSTPRPRASFADPTTKRGYSTAWWGMATLITTESMIFVDPARRVLLPARVVAAVAAARHLPAGAQARGAVQLRAVGEQHPDLLRGVGDPARLAARAARRAASSAA